MFSKQKLLNCLKNTGKDLVSFFGETLYNILVIFVIVVVVRTFLVSPFHVSGRSMVPTLQDSDYIIIDKISYSFSQPEFGDVIIFTPPNPRMREATGIQCFVAKVSAFNFTDSACILPDFFIKRVIGVPGDTIEIQDGEVVRNGKVLDETYLNDTNKHHTNISVAPGEPEYRKYTVPEGRYFVLGDNRTGSSDSRANGAREWSSKATGEYYPYVDPKDIQGRLTLVLLSPYKIQAHFAQ
jgi:signal peptidase I